MKKALIIITLFIGQAALAKTTTYKVEGMHCGSCAEAVKKEVCAIEGLEKCEVMVGKVVISPKAGVMISQKQVEDALTTAGEYKVISSKQSK